MAAMNLRDYAETTKIAAMIGGGGLLAYLVWKSGILQGAAKVTGAVSDAVGYVKNHDDAQMFIDANKYLTDKTNAGGVGLGSGDFFGLNYWWLNPGLMIPGYNSKLTADAIGVKATSAYIVIRARDFDSQWKMKDTAYLAAVKMHQDNKAILDKHVISGGTLKTAFRNLVKTADFVVIYPDGSFKSA